MKNKLKSIATVFALVLMFSIFGTSVLADVVSVTEKIQLSWRGNGSVSSYNADEVSIGKNEDVTLQTRVTCTLDPNTVKHWVTAIAELRVTRWYGYDTIIKETLCNASPMLNNDDDTKVYSYYTSKNGKTTVTGDYYLYASTSGMSNAFYNKFEATVIYTAGE